MHAQRPPLVERAGDLPPAIRGRLQSRVAALRERTVGGLEQRVPRLLERGAVLFADRGHPRAPTGHPARREHGGFGGKRVEDRPVPGLHRLAERGEARHAE